MRIILILVLTFTLNLNAKERYEYWEDIGMGLGHLQTYYINNTICNKSNISKLRCIYSLNKMISTNEQVVILPPVGIIQLQNVPFKQMKRVESVIIKKSFSHIVKMKDLPKGLRLKDYYRSENELQMSVIKTWDYYLARVSTFFDADSILKDFETTVKMYSQFRQINVGAAVKGIESGLVLSNFDHVSIHPKAWLNRKLTQSKQSYSGAGLTLEIQDNKITITQIVSNSSAEKVGFKINDIIVSVNGTLVSGTNLKEFSRKISGEDGKAIQIKVSRSGKEIDLAVILAEVTRYNVESKVLTKGSHKIGYISIETFLSKSVALDVKNAVLNLQRQNVKSLILDLRDNGGGLMGQSLEIVNFFIPKGLKTVGSKHVRRKKDPIRYWHTKSDPISNLPIVIIQNSASASASELVAGILKDHKRAIVIGDRSFGKGTMQAPYDLKNINDAMAYLTTHRFYLPLGTSNQLVGITPHLRVESKKQ